MKTTVFRFGVKVRAADPSSLMDKVKEKLLGIPGVTAVETTEKVSLELAVQAQFEDSEVAKKLHRRIMNALIKTDGLTITSISTNLTEVFD